MALHRFRYVGDDERTFPSIVVADENGDPVTLTVQPGDVFEHEGLTPGAPEDDLEPLDKHPLFERLDKPKANPKAKAKQADADATPDAVLADEPDQTPAAGGQE